ncbi:MAG TPA: TIM-barrel domain-containing protein [Solirubrobacterales bacterium]|nr:TIM-barrel domain-containing protein [Solirubrobacterales bacterium]
MARRGAQLAAGFFVFAALLICASAASAQVSSGDLRVGADSDPWHLTVTDGAGHLVLSENRGLGAGPTGTLGFSTSAGWFHATRVASGGMQGGSYVAQLETTDPARGIQVRIDPGGDGVISLSASVTGSTAGVTAIGMGFDAQPSERYLGFGERSNAVNQRGNEVENYVSDGPYAPADRSLIGNFIPPQGWHPRDDATYFPVPWLLSTAGYGVLLGNEETSYFRLGSSDPSAWSVEAQATTLDLRFIAGPEPADALRRLTELTGRQPPVAAPWVFGPWYQPTGSDQLGQARSLREADVPGSAVNTYLHYLPCGAQQGVESQQPPFTSAFHDLGYAITTYFNPMICTSYQPAYSQAAAAGVLNTNQLDAPYVYNLNTGNLVSPVSQFDFTAPGAQAFWNGLIGEAVGHGYDGWMEDFGEYTPLDAKSADGTPGTRMHNLYPTLYHCATRDYAQGAPHPLAPFVRSGWTGTQRCAQIVWGGDPTTDWGYDGLDSAIKQALSLGTSGISRWGSDIGGYFGAFAGKLSLELLVRWIEFGAASGVMRTEANGFNLGPNTRPQIFDPAILPIWRRYAKLRTQLYPYLLAADGEYRRTGMPLMRDLALVYPSDQTASAQEDEFMFGPDLLVAPVRQPGETKREIYLPGGRWVDFWKAVSYRDGDGSLRLRKAKAAKGGRSVTVSAPLEQLPLMVRAGAILPLLPADTETLAGYGTSSTVGLDDVARRLHLIAFPRGKSRSPFGENGGLRSKEGKHSWKLTVRRAEGYRIQLDASLTTLKHRLRPCVVRLDGKRLKRKAWSAKKGVLSARFRTKGEVAHLGVIDRSRCDRG